MEDLNLQSEALKQYEAYLVCRERSKVTVEKYRRDIRMFVDFLQRNGVVKGSDITKESVIAYKEELIAKGYAVRSINSMLAGVNGLLTFLGWADARVGTLKLQKEIFCKEDQELSKQEYKRLLRAAEGNVRLRMVLQTICSTGIRVSELRFFTVEHVKRGTVQVCCKNKSRTILIPEELRKKLLCFAGQQRITAGCIFRTRNGKQLDRSNIWSEMKTLCRKAGVKESKVFPHNLRKLFARTFYEMEKDIAKLADVLGHSSIETTRIYILTTFVEHRKLMDRLGLII